MKTGHIFLGIGSSLLLLVARVIYLFYRNVKGYNRFSTKRQKSCKIVICIGSGGHTTEMLKLVHDLNFRKYTPRYYFMASNDTTSLIKIKELEECPEKNKQGEYHICQIPRSRVVNQSYITSIFTTVYAILYSIPLVFNIVPDLILCNGPGTCIPICGLGFLLKTLFIKDVKIVFVESFCRTKTLSLSGKMLLYLADIFVVQWQSLKQKIQRADYIGQLM
nr:unnamed protein product [Callosobruchus analis]